MAKKSRLEHHPRWSEIELRLRHRWSARRVAVWARQMWPQEPLPSYRTLQRYLRNKSETWFFNFDLVPGNVAARETDLIVLEKHREAILALKMRIKRGMEEEAKLPSLLPEVRLNLELLSKMLEAHLKLQQMLGLEVRGVPEAGAQLEVVSSGPVALRVRGIDLTKLSAEELERLEEMAVKVRKGLDGAPE